MPEGSCGVVSNSLSPPHPSYLLLLRPSARPPLLQLIFLQPDRCGTPEEAERVSRVAQVKRTEKRREKETVMMCTGSYLYNCRVAVKGVYGIGCVPCRSAWPGD